MNYFIFMTSYRNEPEKSKRNHEWYSAVEESAPNFPNPQYILIPWYSIHSYRAVNLEYQWSLLEFTKALFSYKWTFGP